MFLVFTADKKGITNDQQNDQIVYIGKWCFKNIDFNDREKLKSIDYHWVKHHEIIQSQKYLFSLYIKVLKKLTNKLNEYHKLNLEDKYWEYLIGTWLWLYLQNIYDRYLSLKSAELFFPNISVLVNTKKFICESLNELNIVIQDDYYNEYLYSNLILNSNFKFYVKKNFSNYNILNNKFEKNFPKKKNNLSFILKIKKIISYLRNFISEFIGSRYNFFLDLNSPLDGNAKKNLYTKLNQIFYSPSILSLNFESFRQRFLKHIPIDEKNRYQILGLNCDNDFEKILNKVTFGDLPREYLEDFKIIRDLVKKKLPISKPTKVLIRAQTEISTILRFLISELSLHKSKIISCQEGGGAGAKILSQYPEKIYLRFCDQLLNWGWYTNEPKIKKFFFTKSFWIKDYKYNTNGNLLIVGASCRRYFLDHERGQLPFYNDIHLDLNTNLISNLNKTIFNDLIYRLHWQYGHKEDEILIKNFPNIKLSYREQESHFYRLFNNSRLNICTTDFTIFKQCFVVNHPTILLWDRNYFQYRNSASYYYDLLREVNILHHDPIECANFINDIYEDPLEWWLSEAVQKAKNIYMTEFCNVSNSIEDEMYNTFKTN